MLTLLVIGVCAQSAGDLGDVCAHSAGDWGVCSLWW